MKDFITDFFSKCDQISKGKLDFLCSGKAGVQNLEIFYMFTDSIIFKQ